MARNSKGEPLERFLKRMTARRDGARPRLKLRAAAQGVPMRHLIERHLRASVAAVSGSTRSGDMSTAEVTAAAAAGGGAFAFWERSEEDIYLPTDGKPLEEEDVPARPRCVAFLNPPYTDPRHGAFL